MTAPNPYQPNPFSAPVTPSNGLGTSGFVLGLIGLIFSPIPFIGVIAWPLVIVGLILSLVGHARVRRGTADNGGLAVAGIVLSALGLIVCIVWVVALGKTVADTANSLPTAPISLPAAGTSAPAAQAAADKHTVVYRVTGTGKASSITYTTDGMTSSSQASNVKLPWEKKIELPAGEAFQVVSILAQGSGQGTIKVTIEVDGKVVKEATADGYGVANANENIGTFGH